MTLENGKIAFASGREMDVFYFGRQGCGGMWPQSGLFY